MRNIISRQILSICLLTIIVGSLSASAKCPPYTRTEPATTRVAAVERTTTCCHGPVREEVKAEVRAEIEAEMRKNNTTLSTSNTTSNNKTNKLTDIANDGDDIIIENNKSANDMEIKIYPINISDTRTNNDQPYIVQQGGYTSNSDRKMEVYQVTPEELASIQSGQRSIQDIINSKANVSLQNSQITASPGVTVLPNGNTVSSNAQIMQMPSNNTQYMQPQAYSGYTQPGQPYNIQVPPGYQADIIGSMPPQISPMNGGQAAYGAQYYPNGYGQMPVNMPANMNAPITTTQNSQRYYAPPSYDGNAPQQFRPEDLSNMNLQNSSYYLK